MKQLLSRMIIASALIISIFTSCKKDDSYPDLSNRGGTSQFPMTVSLTTTHWEAESDGVLVNTFKNVIPGTAHYVEIFLESGGTETLLDHPVQFKNGALYATSTQTDVKIYFRGTQESALDVNIKLVIR